MSAVDGDSGHGYKSIPPVAFIHESARGAVERKSQTRSCCCCHVSSDDVRRTSFKLLTELMVTRCKELLISVMPEMRTLNSVKDVLSFDAFVGCQTVKSQLSLACLGDLGLSGDCLGWKIWCSNAPMQHVTQKLYFT